MFTLPTTAAAFSMPSVPSGVLPSFDAFGRNVAVLDDVKSKAQRGCSELTLDFIHCTEKCSLLPCCATPFPTSELESSAKKEFSKAEDKVLSKVPESAGGNKIELYSGRYYATCALGGAVACGATHTFGEWAVFCGGILLGGKRASGKSKERERPAGDEDSSMGQSKYLVNGIFMHCPTSSS